jgi:hypothetical protein
VLSIVSGNRIATSTGSIRCGEVDFGKDGRPGLAYVGVSLDITQRKLAEGVGPVT